MFHFKVQSVRIPAKIRTPVPRPCFRQNWVYKFGHRITWDARNNKDASNNRNASYSRHACNNNGNRNITDVNTRRKTRNSRDASTVGTPTTVLASAGSPKTAEVPETVWM
jgi:hypothetical protein